MQKAIKIVGIIYIVFLAIGIIVFGILGGVFTAVQSSPDMLAQLAKQLGVNVNDAATIVATYSITFWVMFAFSVVPLIFDIVILAKNGKNATPMSKGGGIALGIVAFLFGLTVPGILQIVKSASSNKQ